MKNIIILSVFAFTLCNGLLLRELATVTVTGADNIKACMLNPYSNTVLTQEFSLTNEGKVKIDGSQTYMKLINISDDNEETVPNCKIEQDSETKMTCTFSAAPDDVLTNLKQKKLQLLIRKTNWLLMKVQNLLLSQH